MKAHQRLIREEKARTPEPNEHLKRQAASSFVNARVSEISREEAESVILEYEWLQNMGSSRFYYGLFFGPYLAGVTCFGSTAGTNSHASLCGEQYAEEVVTLTRGACVHWADPPRISSDGRIHGGAAASHLISHSCKAMAKRGFHGFIGFADPDAGEEGIVYRASNWLYCGLSSPTEEFRWTREPVENDEGRDWKNGEWHNCRSIHAYTRNRENRRLLRSLVHHGFAEDRGKAIRGSRVHPYLQHQTRSQQRAEMMAEGFEFRMGHPKGRYVHFAGDKRIVKELRAALKWKKEPYPERRRSANGQFEESLVTADMVEIAE
jgi:hypothetical protein